MWNSARTALLDQTTTNASGNYTLTVPGPMSVRIRVILFGGGAFTTKDAAIATDQTDSDINPSGLNFGFTDTWVIPANTISSTNWDAGITGTNGGNCPTSVGDRVFVDADADGVQDPGEGGLGGVRIELWDTAKSTMLSSTISDANGAYSLPPPSGGTYRIKAIVPDYYRLSPANVGADTTDSDILTSGPDAGYSNTFSIPVNTVQTQHDVGLIPPPAPVYVPLTPARLLDTRIGSPTVDNQFSGIGIRPPFTPLELVVAGRAGVPANAKAVVLNVTAAGASVPGFVTVYPCGSAVPNASNLNYSAGQVVPNAVTVTLGAGGKVCLSNPSDVHLIADVAGYFPSTTQYVPLAPARLADTRSTGVTVDGLYVNTGKLAPFAEAAVKVTSRGSVPAAASAVVLNVTAVDPATSGFLTVYPCGEPRPNASNLNFTPGSVTPNMVVATVGVGGSVCFASNTAVDLVVDVAGAFPAGVGYQPLLPARLADTRPGGTTADGLFQGVGALAPFTPLELTVAGREDVRHDAAAVMLNVTATQGATPGFLTVYPCGETAPTSSNVNFAAGQTIPNAVVTKVGVDGKVCIVSNTSVHVIVDVGGVVLPYGINP